MLSVRFVFTLLVAALLLPPSTDVYAQDSYPKSTLTGGIQLRAAYGTSAENNTAVLPELDRLGLGIRRVRARYTFETSAKAGLFIQVEGNNGFGEFIDAFGYYRFSDALELRVGRFPETQPRSHIATPYFLIDAVERPNIASRWASATLGGDGRDFGIAARYSKDRTQLTVMLGNGDGSWDRARGNYRETVVSGAVTRRINRTSMALSGAVTHQLASLESVEVGGFASLNTSRNPNTRVTGSDLGRQYVSYGAHAYWGANPGSQPIRAKLDLLATQYEERGPFAQQTALGYAAFLAARLTTFSEVFARAEQYDAVSDEGPDGDVYITAGASLSLSQLRGDAYHTERLTLAYSTLQPGADLQPTQHVLILQAQILF